MADLALKTAGRIEVVQSFLQFTVPPAESLTPGQAARQDVNSGKATKSNATSAAEARFFGVAVSPSSNNLGVTLIRRGILDGFVLDALAYDAPVYLSDTDGALSTAAGTNSVVVGRVVRGSANIGGAGKKLLLIDP